ncbi:unnamed protein product [Rhodiola kirilowii]
MHCIKQWLLQKNACPVLQSNRRCGGSFCSKLNIASSLLVCQGCRSDVERAFIGAGCNRVVNNVSWGACGLVSFGSQNAVSIFCPKTGQILTTLPGHKASVNCTHWLPSNKFAFKAKDLDKHFLLSGDAEGVIILWELSVLDRKWRHIMQVPESHKKGVTCISSFMISKDEAIFASTSSDGKVNIWEARFPSSFGGDCILSCLQSLPVGSKPMVAISIAELPGKSSEFVLAMGGLDNKIHLYCGDRKGSFGLLVANICRCTTSNLLLVSSSQDKGVRIWKVAPVATSTNGAYKKEEISLAAYIKGPLMVAGSSSYQISLESLQIGHEDWVYSVEWQPPKINSKDGITYTQPQSILSASIDKTMMIWQPERTTGIWMNVVTVGELSHSALGFYGGHWSPDGDSILAHGYGGSFHLWKNIGVDYDNWQPQKVPSGHFSAVTDIEWGRSGEYLLSVSHDQTTRIYAPWKNVECPKGEPSWHEIARPQVHGHDIHCVTIIKAKGNHRFVSGADEKVARVFEAPLSFLKSLAHATSKNLSPEDLQLDIQILGANMSALGLSQKPIYANASSTPSNKTSLDDIGTLETVPDAAPVEFTQVPIEEQLAWHTLWPESHKLYGHGNELFSLCGDNEGKLVASSCKAQSAAVAEIWLWLVGSWKAVGRLQSHTLTVTQLAFSHDDKYLLSVSRDRPVLRLLNKKIRIRPFRVYDVPFIRVHSDEFSHQLVARQEAHKRIIWACSWNPFGHQFATGSRDKMVKIWTVENSSSVKLLITLPTFNTSVTALSWVGLNRQTNYGLLAVGMENGLIELRSISISTSQTESSLTAKATIVQRLDPFMCHASAVNSLAWRFSTKNVDSESIELASCGADNCVRVYKVSVY